jgi:hypothetical protein
MLRVKYDWVVYDTESIPNVFRCLICGETLEVLTPSRLSTYKVLGEQFANQHSHIHTQTAMSDTPD